MKKIYLLFVLFLLVAAGCQDLNTSPEGDDVTSNTKSEVVANDPSKAVAAVNGIFAQFNQYMPNATALNASRHNDIGYPSVMLFTDVNGYDITCNNNGYQWMGNNLTFADRIFTSRECQILWNDMYKMIYTTNNLIAASDIETTNPQSQFFVAQGLSVRAFCYGILAQLYQFNYTGHETATCVPIITDENSNDAALNGAPLATVQEVYDQAMKDINSAVDLLKSAESNGIKRADKRYVSLAVAYGIRARINLAMQKWQDAASDATNAIQSSDATPASIADVSKPYFKSASEGEWMWGIIIAPTDRVVTSGIVNWISHMGSLNYGYANYSGGYQINKALYNSIPATDARKGWWLDVDQTSINLNAEQQQWMDDYGYAPYTQVKFAPYEDVVGTSINSNDVPLMRVEEMYLIKAEAEAMSGGNGKATLENFIKQYRDPAYTCTASSPADVQAEVYRQRRIELWGEGLSWYDIMRLNIPVDRRGAGYPNAPSVFNIAPGSNILLWPIPETEINSNQALKGYTNPPAPAPTPVPDIN